MGDGPGVGCVGPGSNRELAWALGMERDWYGIHIIGSPLSGRFQTGLHRCGVYSVGPAVLWMLLKIRMLWMTQLNKGLSD